MAKRLAQLLLWQIAIFLSQGSSASANPVQIVVRNQPQHEVDKFIYGNFGEFLGKSDGGLAAIWDSSKEDFRTDVLRLLKELHVSLFRFPGGCFADTYHWRDGVGPREKRPTRKNIHWGGVEENKIGTDELLSLSRQISSEPLITVNFGTADPKEAAAWVDYVNRKKKYGVRYWEIGNEVYGFWEEGHTSAYRYAKRYIKFAKAMKAIDNNIKLMAVGLGTPIAGTLWNRKVLKIAGQKIDYLTLHLYAPFSSPKKKDEKFYYYIQAHDQAFEKVIRETERLIKGSHYKIKIAVTEWNVLLGGDVPDWSEKFKAALFVASVLNLYQRTGNIVKMATLSDLVNTNWSIGSVQISKKSAYGTPTYEVLKLYAEHTGKFYLPVESNSPTFSVYGLQDNPYLSTSATQDKKHLFLYVVNRHIHKNISTQIKLDGFQLQGRAVRYTLRAPLEAKNSFQRPHQIKVETTSLSSISSSFRYTFPSHSITLLEINLK